MKFQVVSKRKKSDVDLSVRLAPEKKTGSAFGLAAGDVLCTERNGGATVVVSLGPRKDLTCEQARCAGGAAAKWLGRQTVKRATVDLAQLDAIGLDGAAEAFCEGMALASFTFDRHKSGTGNNRTETVVEFLPAKGGTKAKVLRDRVAICDGVNLARAWGHEPPNVINPVTLARRVQTWAKGLGLKCQVLDEKQLKRMKAGAILGVGQGSESPPRMIILEHAGSGAKRAVKPVVVVGKAITFDTGGYSLKDKNGMVGMKYDKCGGMNVLGVMHAAATLQLKTPVVGIIAAAENMVSAQAYRPNDIITAMNGKTVEIISTDAEGRLALADALIYGCKQYKPRSIINMATLTGGVVVALGTHRAGIMGNHDELCAELSDCGDAVHELLWRLPLDDAYFDLIKGDDSDMKNSAGREAHAIIGGLFLKQFVDEKVPWAHLDIAATGVADKELPYCPKGATGFGVRLLMEYLRRLG